MKRHLDPSLAGPPTSIVGVVDPINVTLTAGNIVAVGNIGVILAVSLDNECAAELGDDFEPKGVRVTIR